MAKELNGASCFPPPRLNTLNDLGERAIISMAFSNASPCRKQLSIVIGTEILLSYCAPLFDLFHTISYF